MPDTYSLISPVIGDDRRLRSSSVLEEGKHFHLWLNAVFLEAGASAA